MGAHADNFAGELFGLLNAACAVDEHITVTKLTMRKHRDRSERRTSSHPTEKNAHLKLANVKFQIAGKPSVALLGRQRDDVEIDTLGLHRTVDQEACSVVFVAG